MAGLFTTLNTSVRGLSTQQKAIDVTSHNISNANTDGYSRQRAVIETASPFSMPATNMGTGALQLGTGSMVTAIDRFRDTFVDYQIRTQTSTKGQYDALQGRLGEVESIFNEPSENGITTLMTKFFSAWQQLSKAPNDSNTRTIVAQQSQALAGDLNDKYIKLMKLKTDTQSDIQSSIVDVNSKLTQLTQLNKEIREVSITGNKANDLMDKRDLLLDQLSTKFNINITKTELDGIDVSPVDTTGVPSPNLVSSVQNNPNTDKRLSYINSITKNPAGTAYNISYYSLGDMTDTSNLHTINIPVTSITQQQVDDLNKYRTVWTDSTGTPIDSAGNQITSGTTVPLVFKPTDGEIKGDAATQDNIDTYIDQLNNLARVLAFAVNTVHSGMTDPQAGGTPAYDGMPFFVNSDVAQYNTNGTMANLTGTGGILDSEEDITAGNISVNKQIINDVSQIKTRTNDNQYLTESGNLVDGEADGARALAIADLANTLFTVADASSITKRSDLGTVGGNTVSNNGMTFANNVNGTTLASYFKNTIDKLGIQSQEAQRMVKNTQGVLDNFNTSKASVSGVSLDEEMANLVQFQHAYQANAKVISTVDDLLDVVINGLKK